MAAGVLLAATVGCAVSVRSRALPAPEPVLAVVDRVADRLEHLQQGPQSGIKVPDMSVQVAEQVKTPITSNYGH